MSQSTGLFCEIFVIGTHLSREELSLWFVTNAHCVMGSTLLSPHGLELEVRNNPRLKQESPSELCRLRADSRFGFVFSDLTIEITPANETMVKNEFIAAVRSLLEQFQNHGFEFHIASDFEDELIV